MIPTTGLGLPEKIMPSNKIEAQPDLANPDQR
jgi:hypothetical protein